MLAAAAGVGRVRSFVQPPRGPVGQSRLSSAAHTELTSRKGADYTDSFACKRSPSAPPALQPQPTPTLLYAAAAVPEKSRRRPVASVPCQRPRPANERRGGGVGLSSCAAAAVKRRVLRTTRTEHERTKGEEKKKRRQAPVTCGVGRFLCAARPRLLQACEVFKSPRPLPLTAPQSCLQRPPPCVV
jgi:hypothetical protein